MVISSNDFPCFFRLETYFSADLKQFLAAWQWRRQPFKSGGDFGALKARDTSRGVRGHAPPGKFLKSRVPEIRFPAFSG